MVRPNEPPLEREPEWEAEGEGVGIENSGEKTGGKPREGVLLEDGVSAPSILGTLRAVAC